MNIISGIVMKDSYYYTNSNNHYIINFPIQVDRRVFVFGQLMVHLTNPSPLKFKSGMNITIKGEVFFENGCRIMVDDYQIS